MHKFPGSRLLCICMQKIFDSENFNTHSVYSEKEMYFCLAIFCSLFLRGISFRCGLFQAKRQTTVLQLSTVQDFLQNNMLPTILWKNSFNLADTSVSNEDVLQISGQVSNLPNPIFVIGLCTIIIVGVFVLQVSLGDLTKEVK